MTLKDRPDLDPMVQGRNRIVAMAEEAGWTVSTLDPLVLNKDARLIEVGFNGGGMPNSAKWTGGDEFGGMGASGYMDLNTLFGKWFAWEPKTDE